MKQRPPLNDTIAFALARMVDDAQIGRRDPSHSDIQFCITNWKLTQGDPNSQGQTVGKAKRVRSVLTWAIEHSFVEGRGFVGQLIAMVQSHGGFRIGSPNYVGDEAITSLREAMASEGFVLTSDDELRPTALDSMSGAELTEALWAYVRRAQNGAEDAGLLVGTGKDLLEAISAHVLCECWGQHPAQSNFPTLLGQAFIVLGLKTPADNPANGEPPQHRLHRALYEAACSVNSLRNKEGTGHGRPWLPSVSQEEARYATQVMGVVGELLLRTLKQRKGL
jgi:Abortive infection C-terminus